MYERLQLLQTVAAAVADAFGDRGVGAFAADELLSVNAVVARLRRIAEGVQAEVAAEIARRSRPELGSAGLARENGFRSPKALVSAATGSTWGDATRLIQVGEAIAPRPTLSGVDAPAKRPHVAAAVHAGVLSASAAAAIVTILDRVSFRAPAAEVERAERTLVTQAPGLTLDQLATLIARAEAHLDPDGQEPREDELRGDRSLTIRQESSGMILLTARLDPETGAPVTTVIEAMVAAQLRRRDDAPAVVADTRSVRQMQADALADLCRHALGCDLTRPAGASTTVIVRIDLATLDGAPGTATIDGIDRPLSAGAARRLAAAANVIPIVLGTKSEPLDWGRTKRLFTHAQRFALLERDGGCASCGAPPGWTHAHHIHWWHRDRGPTDLANGVMLCTTCHHRIHADGWIIHVTGTASTDTVWFTPPAHVDPTRTPRLGGRRRYDLTLVA